MNLDQERQAEIMRAFERGARLHQVRSAPGWQDVLDILEAEAVKYEFRLLNVRAGASSLLIRDLRTHATAVRSLFEQLQLRINAAIDQSTEQALTVDDNNQNYNL